MKWKILYQWVIALLVMLFSYTAISKFRALEIFTTQLMLSPFHILSYNGKWIAWLIPCMEMIVVVLLLFSRTQKLGLILSLGLLISFEIYLGILLLSRLELPCTCGGVISKMSWTQHWWFNLFFIVIAIAGIRYSTDSIIHVYKE